MVCLEEELVLIVKQNKDHRSFNYDYRVNRPPSEGFPLLV